MPPNNTTIASKTSYSVMPGSWPMNASPPRNQPATMEGTKNGAPASYEGTLVEMAFARHKRVAALQAQVELEDEIDGLLPREIGSHYRGRKTVSFHRNGENSPSWRSPAINPPYRRREAAPLFRLDGGLMLGPRKQDKRSAGPAAQEAPASQSTAQGRGDSALPAEIARLTEFEMDWKKAIEGFEDVNRHLSRDIERYKKQAEEHASRIDAYERACDAKDREIAALAAELAAREAALLDIGRSCASLAAAADGDRMDDLLNETRLREAEAEANGLRCELEGARDGLAVERGRSAALAGELEGARAFAHELLDKMAGAGVRIEMREDGEGRRVTRVYLPMPAPTPTPVSVDAGTQTETETWSPEKEEVEGHENRHVRALREQLERVSLQSSERGEAAAALEQSVEELRGRLRERDGQHEMGWAVATDHAQMVGGELAAEQGCGDAAAAAAAAPPAFWSVPATLPAPGLVDDDLIPELRLPSPLEPLAPTRPGGHLEGASLGAMERYGAEGSSSSSSSSSDGGGTLTPDDDEGVEGWCVDDEYENIDSDVPFGEDDEDEDEGTPLLLPRPADGVAVLSDDDELDSSEDGY